MRGHKAHVSLMSTITQLQTARRRSDVTRRLRLLSAPDAISQVEDPVALDDNARILEHVLGISRAEVPLAFAEHHGYDVHRHLIHQAERERLTPDVARTDRDHTVTCSSLGLMHRGGDVLDERDISLGVPTLRFGSVGHHNQMLSGRRLGLPAVGQVK